MAGLPAYYVNIFGNVRVQVFNLFMQVTTPDLDTAPPIAWQSSCEHTLVKNILAVTTDYLTSQHIPSDEL